MSRHNANYGIQRSHTASYGPLYESSTVVATKNERLWSVVAHLSTFLNTFTGFLGPVVAAVIWLANRRSSPMVASHALRSVVYQIVWLTLIAAGWAITLALTTVLIGFLLWPVMALVTLAPFIHSAVAAYDAYRDRNIYL